MYSEGEQTCPGVCESRKAAGKQRDESCKLREARH
jgi:hypothetical protein